MIRDVSAALSRVSVLKICSVHNCTDYSNNFFFYVAENEEFLSF